MAPLRPQKAQSPSSRLPQVQKSSRLPTWHLSAPPEAAAPAAAAALLLRRGPVKALVLAPCADRLLSEPVEVHALDLQVRSGAQFE